MKERPQVIQVFLKFNQGIFSRKIFVPLKQIERGNIYVVPLKKGMSLSQINASQTLMSDLKSTSILAFRNLGEKLNGVPVLELTHTENL